MTKALALFITLIALLACGTIGLPFLFARHQETEYARKAHQDRMREMRLAQGVGISLSAQSLTTPVPSPAEDVSPIYDNIDSELKALPFSMQAIEPVTSSFAHYPPSASEISQVQIALCQRAKLVSRIHAAVEKKKGALRLEWSAQFPELKPTLGFIPMRRTAWILEAESIVLAQKGRVQDAVHNQALGFRLADHCVSGKTLTYAITGDAINAIALQGMKKILYFHGGDPAVAKAVMAAVHDNEHTPNITSALRAEATFQFVILEYLRTANPKFVLPATPAARIGRWKLPQKPQSKEQMNAYLDATEAAVLHQQRLNILASESPFPEAKQRFQSNLNDWNKQRANMTELAQAENNPPSEFAATAWADRASALILETSARLLIWKSQHGAFPKSLNILGVTPLDPMSGNPFGYRREGAGFVLYSVGESGTFDGGSPKIQPQDHPLMFRYPIPKYLKK